MAATLATNPDRTISMGCSERRKAEWRNYRSVFVRVCVCVCVCLWVCGFVCACLCACMYALGRLPVMALLFLPGLLSTCVFPLSLVQVWWYREGDLPPKFRYLIAYITASIVIMCICSIVYFRQIHGKHGPCLPPHNGTNMSLPYAH